ncbi:MAG: TetR/AcrR family transcriptional regulator [Pseudomonadota bacterium]
MARPSKKNQRREEIIDAFERCVVRFGLEGSTLQRVADESGLARPLIHHNVGNRDDLLRALLERLERQGAATENAFRALLPDSGRCAAMIELLFDARYASGSHEVLLHQALLAAAQEQAPLRRLLLDWHNGFVEQTEQELVAEYPQADSAVTRAVAVGIVALYLNADSMAPLASDSTLFRDSKRAAHRLLETLSWTG